MAVLATNFTLDVHVIVIKFCYYLQSNFINNNQIQK